MSVPQAMWSVTMERCASGGMASRTTRGPSGPVTSITTRSTRKITLSPGRGYRQASSSGSPTFVRTRYMWLTPRPSCWKVAMRRESGDHVSTGISLRTHPALFVAYPKSSTPSAVCCVSSPVSRSRTQRSKSRRNAARRPSGDTTE